MQFFDELGGTGKRYLNLEIKKVEKEKFKSCILRSLGAS